MVKHGTRLTYGGFSFSMKCFLASFLSSNFIYRLLRNGKAISVEVAFLINLSCLMTML